MTQQEFIAAVMKAAAEIQKKYGLPAATITAQACLETGYGKYVLKQGAKYSYNLFNIKGSGPAGSVSVVAWEVVNGKKVDVKSNFRAYNNFEESFEDYSKLIIGYSRYAPAVAVKGNPDEYARQLQKCGYATDPAYPQKLISIMNQYNLRELANNLIGSEKPVTEKQVPEWKQKIMSDAKAAGLITSDDHGPDDPADKWFVLAVGLNVLREISKQGK